MRPLIAALTLSACASTAVAAWEPGTLDPRGRESTDDEGGVRGRVTYNGRPVTHFGVVFSTNWMSFLQSEPFDVHTETGRFAISAVTAHTWDIIIVARYSSGVTFTGWSVRVAFRLPPEHVPLPVSPPRSSLLASDWKQYGLIDPYEVPGPLR